MSRSLLYIFLITVMLLPGKLHAQNFEAGPFLGFSAYTGDLNTERMFHKIYPAVGAVARFNHNNRLSTRVNATYTVLRGSDRSTEQPYRNILEDPAHPAVYYEFETDVVEISVQGELNILPFRQGDMLIVWAPYLFAGAGGIYFNPDPMEFANGGTFREPTGGDHWGTGEDGDYLNLALVTFAGVGVKYNVSSNFSGTFEIGMRISNTDYLDEVSRKGDPGQTDWYSFTGLTLTYGFDGYRSFRSGKGCPY